MSIIPKLLALGLATTLSSTGPQSQVDFSMPGPDGRPIKTLWLVTYVNDAGQEIIAVAKAPNGDSLLLIAADQSRMESMMPTARELAKTNNIKMRLVKFDRVGMQDIVP